VFLEELFEIAENGEDDGVSFCECVVRGGGSPDEASEASEFHFGGPSPRSKLEHLS